MKNVVSEMTGRGLEQPQKDYAAFRRAGEEIGVAESGDVLIIGAVLVRLHRGGHVLNILARELGRDKTEINLAGDDGNILISRTK